MSKKNIECQSTIINNANNYQSMIKENFCIVKEIGRGSFGSVYQGKHRHSGEDLACKVEKKTQELNKERLRDEYKIYKFFRMKSLTCVPKVYSLLRTKALNIMIMQLLGKSLDVILLEHDNHLDLGTVMCIGLLIISGIEQIHQCGIIHRDIKPNNFMFGRKEDNDDCHLYIVDFGLSKFWKNSVNGSHISHKQGRSLIGTARYASINIHLGIEPSRRDDLESIGYLLVYLAKGSLPWQGLQKKKNGSSINDIRDKKMSTSTEKLCFGLPECFREIIDYAKSLSFQEKPDYELMKNIIIQSAQTNNIELCLAWDC